MQGSRVFWSRASWVETVSSRMCYLMLSRADTIHSPFYWSELWCDSFAWSFPGWSLNWIWMTCSLSFFFFPPAIAALTLNEECVSVTWLNDDVVWTMLHSCYITVPNIRRLPYKLWSSRLDFINSQFPQLFQCGCNIVVYRCKMLKVWPSCKLW